MRELVKWLKENFVWYFVEHDRKSKIYYIKISTRKGNVYCTSIGEHMLKDIKYIENIKQKMIKDRNEN